MQTVGYTDEQSEKLSKTQGTPFKGSEAFQYRSTADALQYLTPIRLDISFAGNRVCRFMQSPTSNCWMAVKIIVRYVKGTITVGLHLKRSSSVLLSAFTDKDWAGCPNDRRSTSGFAIYFGPNLISWNSRKEATMSRSSTEVKYKGLMLQPS